MDEIIRLENVSYAYEEDAPKALAEVSLSLERGSFTAVLGSNGSGKSTLAKLCNGLYLPGEGRVLVDGMDTAEDSHTWEIRRRVGMIFQNPDNQLVATVVRDDVAFGLENLGMPPAEMPGRIEWALQKTGMLEYAEKAPHLLSGGQKQRVAIAGVLAMKPEAIICDEATAMLDPQGRREVLRVLETLNREEGITVLWITHFMEEAVRFRDIYVMDGGRIALHGTPSQVFLEQEKLDRFGLRLPEMTRLSEELIRAGAPIRTCLTAEELAEEIARVHAQGPLPALKAPEGGTPGPAEESPKPEKTEKTEVRLEKVTHTYQQGSPYQATAIREADLTVRDGDFIALIGHTGSGKSTLAQHLNGLLKPTEGRVTLNGEDINQKGFDRRRVRQRVGMVFQYPETQLFEESVRKDIAFGPANLGLEPGEIEERVREAMELVGLDWDTEAEKSPFELSGGRMRRCAIAGVLAMRPAVLVLDEPTAGLDPGAREQLMALVMRMHRQGTVIVMISHSMDDVARCANRAVVLEKGRIVQDGTPEEVFARGEELARMGLDVPQVCGLGALLREKGIPFDPRVIRWEDALAALWTLLSGKEGKGDA